MIFSISVLSAPYTDQAAFSAYKFVESALAKGHSVKRVFFYGEGVLNANHLNTPPQDEIDLHEAWKKLASTHQVELIVCIASALRRGVLDQNEAKRYEKDGYSMLAPFILSGLGQLVDAAIESDRLITFGS
jgi:tRNA 2-thiouridine synthesizing protein D